MSSKSPVIPCALSLWLHLCMHYLTALYLFNCNQCRDGAQILLGATNMHNRSPRKALWAGGCHRCWLLIIQWSLTKTDGQFTTECGFKVHFRSQPDERHGSCGCMPATKPPRYACILRNVLLHIKPHDVDLCRGHSTVSLVCGVCQWRHIVDGWGSMGHSVSAMTI